MPEAAIDDSLWAETTVAQKTEAVRAGRATLRQMVEGLLDGPDELSQVCRAVLTRADASFKGLSDNPNPAKYQSGQDGEQRAGQGDLASAEESLSIPNPPQPDVTYTSGLAATKGRRPGLPRGYLTRLHRHEK